MTTHGPTALAAARRARPRGPRLRSFGAAVAVLLAALSGCGASDPVDPAPEEAFRVLVFSRTTGFRHSSIETGTEALRGLGRAEGFGVDATEDASVFAGDLSAYAVIVFLNTTGDPLDETQQAGMEAFVRGGGGFVGVHSAADTEYEWAWYGGLVGAYFSGHPPIQDATIDVERSDHPSTRHLPAVWARNDEWYNFRRSPRDSVEVLLTLDESTYEGGRMGTDHPAAWFHAYDGGRAWYTAGGHTEASYAEPLFLQHLLGGILWAAGQAS